jgi:NADH-quinone oxidoreductase subunit L
MVNAGVYLLIRMGPLFLLAPNIMIVVAIIGGSTALFAALVALTQFDIKRILAYSTISQLGFMVLACGVGAYAAAIFHLLTHGAMKSFLFLSAGSALQSPVGTHHGEHAEHGHLPRARVSRQHLPIYAGALILALIPPLIIFSGAYEQLWVASQVAQARVVFWILGLATVFFTAFYLFQGIMELFKPPGRVDWYEGFRAGQMRSRLFSASLLLGLIPMTAGLAVFLILIWGGFLEFINPALPGTEQALKTSASWSPANMIPGFGFATAGWAVAFYFHVSRARSWAWWSERKKTLYVFFLNKGYFDEVYEVLIVRPILRFASWLWRVVDGGIDRAYMTAARASAGLARALWQSVDVRLIDRPADWLADASFKMAARPRKVVDLKKASEQQASEQQVSYVLLMLLVLLMILLVLAGGIVFLFLRIVA